MFINTFNVFLPHAIIVLSCKFPMLQLRFLYNIRCNSNRIIYNVTISSSFQFPSQFPSQSPANSTIHSPLHSATLYTHLCLTKNLLIKECDINRI